MEHNGGSSLGHFACTLTAVDVVSGYSRRRAVLGRYILRVGDYLRRVALRRLGPPFR
ncbi:MAG: hypothetical protein H5U02_01415 [Clostridia bacterium]|nr:hypothetical protein [Clostridia bacterium]